MKKIVSLLALAGAAAGAVAIMAKRRGQDIGEFTGEWADRAKDVASSTSDALTDTFKDSSDSFTDVADSFIDDPVDVRDDLPLHDRS